jgi:hypothetical protein
LGKKAKSERRASKKGVSHCAKRKLSEETTIQDEAEEQKSFAIDVGKSIIYGIKEKFIRATIQK